MDLVAVCEQYSFVSNATYSSASFSSISSLQDLLELSKETEAKTIQPGSEVMSCLVALAKNFADQIVSVLLDWRKQVLSSPVSPGATDDLYPFVLPLQLQTFPLLF